MFTKIDGRMFFNQFNCPFFWSSSMKKLYILLLLSCATSIFAASNEKRGPIIVPQGLLSTTAPSNTTSIFECSNILNVGLDNTGAYHSIHLQPANSELHTAVKELLATRTPAEELKSIYYATIMTTDFSPPISPAGLFLGRLHFVTTTDKEELTMKTFIQDYQRSHEVTEHDMEKFLAQFIPIKSNKQTDSSL